MGKEYIRTPSLSDQHWRASLRMRPSAEIAADMAAAIERGHMWRFDILLESFPRLLSPATLFEAAVEHGRFEIFRALDKAYPEARTSSVFNQLPAAAAAAGHFEILVYMLDHDMIRPWTDKDDLFRAAAENGRLDIVDYFLDREMASAQVPDFFMGRVISGGHFAVVRRLVEKGFNPAKSGPDLLYNTVTAGRRDIAEYLLDHGMTIQKNFQQCLNRAAQNGHQGLVTLLLDRDAAGALHKEEALAKALDAGETGIAAVLMSYGADIHHRGADILWQAVKTNNDQALVAFLLQNGVKADDEKNGETLLGTAVQRGARETVRLLLAHGADHRRCQHQAMRHAREKGDADIIRLLEDHVAAWLRDEKQRRRAEFESLFGASYTMDDLRHVKNAGGESGLSIAAQSGAFRDLVGRARGGHLSAADLYHPKSGIDTVYSHLMQHGDLPQFFDPLLWKDSEALEKARRQLPDEALRFLPRPGAPAAAKLRAAAKAMRLKPSGP